MDRDEYIKNYVSARQNGASQDEAREAARSSFASPPAKSDPYMSDEEAKNLYMQKYMKSRKSGGSPEKAKSTARNSVFADFNAWENKKDNSYDSNTQYGYNGKSYESVLNETLNSAVTELALQKAQSQAQQAQQTQNGFLTNVKNRILGDPSEVTNTDVDWGKLAQGTFYKGADQFSSGVANTLDFFFGDIAQEIHNLGGETVNKVLETFGREPIDYGKNFLTRWSDSLKETKEQNLKYFDANSKSSRAAQIVDKFGTATVAAVPMAIETMLFGIAKAPEAVGQYGTQGLNYMSNLFQSKGLGVYSAEAVEGVKNLLKQPDFWTSYLQVTGDSYDSAKESGMSDDNAAIYAITNGAVNALIEIGGGDEGLGGIQNMPKKQGEYNAILELGKSILGEGAEEVQQGVFERGLKSFGGVETPVFSVDPNDSNAIFNPYTAADEFAGGAVIGGLLGGGQLGANAAINTGIQAATPYEGNLQTLAEYTALANDQNLNNKAKKLVERSESNKKVSELQAGKVLNKATNLINKADTETIRSAVAKRLTELGETENVERVAKAIAQTVVDSETESNNKIISASKHGVRVLNELDIDKAEGEPAPWAMNLRTKATVKDTGNVVRGLKVSSVSSNGDIILEDSSGKTYAADQINIPKETQLVYNTMKNLGVTSANDINYAVSMYAASDLNAVAYTRALQEAYTYGKYKMESSLKTGTFAPQISENLARTMYNYGASSVKTAGVQQAKTGTGSKTIGKVVIEFKQTGKEANAKQQAGVRAADIVSKLTGKNIHLYQSYINENGQLVYKNAAGQEVKAPNGFYDTKTGEIWIDVNSGNLKSDGTTEGLVMNTLAHELTHFMKQYSSESFTDLATTLVQEINGIHGGETVDALVIAQQQKAQKNGRTISYDEAFEELVADACETMLHDGTALKTFSEIMNNENLQKTYGEKFMDKLKAFIEDFISKIQEIIDAYKGVGAESTEGKIVDELRKTKNDLQKLWTSGVVAAAQNSSVQNTAAEIDIDGEPGAHMLSTRSMVEGAGFTFKADKNGNFIAMLDSAGNEVKNVTSDMIRKSPIGNVILIAEQNGFIDSQSVEDQCKMFADIMNMINEGHDATLVWDVVGTTVFSAMKSNADKQYSKTIDFSTVCKKTQAIVDAMSAVMLKLGRGLTRAEVEQIYLEVHKAGETVPCPVCYVFSRWMGAGGILDNIKKYQNRYGHLSEAELTDYANGVKQSVKDFWKANGKYNKYIGANGEFKVGKALSDMKTRFNDKSTSKLNSLAKSANAALKIQELQAVLEGDLSKAEIKKLKSQIKTLSRSVLSDSGVKNVEDAVRQNNDEVEKLEAYQFVTKAILEELKDGTYRIRDDFKKSGICPDDILFDLNKGAEFAEKYPSIWGYRTTRGAAAGKAIVPYSDARVGETIQGASYGSVRDIKVGFEENPFLNGNKAEQKKRVESAIEKMRKQNLIGGQRYQSTSDFRYEYGSDYLLTFLEMQAIGANVQLYTKVIEAVDFLATMGADCNLSVMPLADGFVTMGDGTKKLVYSDVTGINYEAALKKTRQYDNVQLILVGISDEHIRLAIQGNEVTFVIPFHGSGNTTHQIQALMNAVGEDLNVITASDYTAVQSDHFKKKRTPGEKAAWNLRTAIIMGKAENLTPEQYKILQQNKYLNELYNKFYVDENAKAYRCFLGKDQAEQIFPYEYWDESLTYDQADENGRRFQEYCKSMGIIPRFSGTDSDGKKVGYGDFTQDKGYWKLLIDRRMYNLDGTYHQQKRINVSGFDIGMLDAKAASLTYGDAMSKANDPSKTNGIRDRVIAQIEANDGIKNSDRYSGIEEGAKEHFGTTDDFKVAGYMLQDGTMLDFSGAHWLDGYDDGYIQKWKQQNNIRQVDHEDIMEVFDNLGYNSSGDNRKKFIGRGNIRMSPEAPGINISQAVEPTAAQYSMLKSFIRDHVIDMDNGFYVDIEGKMDSKGKSARLGKLQYEGKVNADKVINDIKQFYKTGEIAEQSTVSRFHYSFRDNPNAVIGININDKSQSFTDEILSQLKTIETRESQNPNAEHGSLYPYVGKEVAIIKTGKGKAMVVGWATVASEKKYGSKEEFDSDLPKHRIKSTNKYFYWHEGKAKFGYELTNVYHEQNPYVVTEKGIVARDVDRNAQMYTDLKHSDRNSEQYKDLTDNQKKWYDYNDKQTEVGSSLKTLNGSTIQRNSKYGVGKEIGGDIYVHRDYMRKVVPEDILDSAIEILNQNHPGFIYNAIRYSPKTGTISFQEAPDFDTAREPVVGDYFTINPDGSEKKPGHSNYIWHHKWNWVENDYSGFNVADSWNWSKQWLNTLTETSDGNGIGRWEAQLDKFGLPHDEPKTKYSTREISAVVPETGSKWSLPMDENGKVLTTAWYKQNGYPIFEQVDEDKVKEDTDMEGKHKTSNNSTVGTYEKVFEQIKKMYPDSWKDLKILDASSGMGLGTRKGREMGFRGLDDIEPFASDTDYMRDARWWKDTFHEESVTDKNGKKKKVKVWDDAGKDHPMYTDYTDLEQDIENGNKEKYDVIISNAVINVVPIDQRNSYVAALARLMKDGGKLFLNTMTEGYTTKSDVTWDGTQFGMGKEYYVWATNTVQKGFTENELKSYLQQVMSEATGAKFDVSKRKTGAGMGSVWVTKTGEGINYQEYADGNPITQYNEGQIRMSMSERSDGLSTRQLLATALESAAQTPAQKEYLRNYKKYVGNADVAQEQLAKIKQDLKDPKITQDRKIFLQNQATVYEQRIKRIDGKLFQIQSTKPMQDFLHNRLQETVKKQKAIASAEKEIMRNEYSKSRKELVAKMTEDKAAALDQLRKEKNARIQEVRKQQYEHDKEVRERADEKRIENAGKNKYKQRVLEETAKLSDMLLKNSDKQHVPEVLKEPLVDLLSMINFDSKRKLSGGSETKADVKFGRRMQQLQLIITNQQKILNGDENVKGDPFDIYLDMSQESIDFLNDINESIVMLTGSNDTLTLNAMTAEQLHGLSKFLANLNAAIRKANSLLANERYATIREAADQDIENMKRLGRTSGTDSWIGKALRWKDATPYYVFKRFGEGAQSIFDGLTKGWEKLAFNAREIIEFTQKTYTTKEINEWKNTILNITLDSGDVIRMSIPQIMELSQLLNRPQAVGHIEAGGVRIGNIREGRKAIVDTTHYHLTENDITNILSHLSTRQLQVAMALRQYMGVRGGELGNEISMKRFGYRFYTEGDTYYTIKTDSNDRPMKDTDDPSNSMFRLLNLSSSKSLIPHANNALVVNDLFDTFSDHMADMAKLNALGLPILDAIKWFNYKEKIRYDDGTIDTRTIQSAMEQAFGMNAQKYFRTLMKDINGIREGGDRGGEITSKIVSNYKVAAVAANLRVAFLQPTSYVRASFVINPKYLAAAFTHKNGYDEAMKYSGTAVWKSLGYYDTNISKNMRDQIQHADTWKDKLIEASMKGAELGDARTWGRLWIACKLQTKAQNGSLSEEELNQKTADLFRQVIYSSQVMDSTLTRSELMRSNTKYDKALTAFMAEPTVSYNILLDAYNSFKDDQRTLGKAKAWQKNSSKIGKAFSVYAASAAFSAIVESLIDAARDSDDDEFLDKFLKALLGETDKNGVKGFINKFYDGNLGSDLSLLAKIPLLKNIVSFLQGYGSSDMSTEGISKLIDAFEVLSETYDLAVGNIDKPTKATYYGNMTPWGKIYKTLQSVSMLSGIPASAALRDTFAIWNTIVNDTHPEWKIRTYDDGSTGKWQEVSDIFKRKPEHDRFAEKVKNAAGKDEDGDGKIDSGSKKSEVMRIIDELSITSEQKDRLYLQQGYSEKTLKDAPWH